MIATIIKFFALYFFTIYIYQLSLHANKRIIINNFIIAGILSLITYIINPYSKELRYIIPLLLLWIIASLHNSQPQITFAAITISFTISFTIHVILSFVLSLFLVLILGTNEHLTIFSLIIGFLQLLLTKKLLSTKRFSKGIPFLSTTSHLTFVTIFGIILISATIYITLFHTEFRYRTLGIFFFIACVLTLAFLIYWWQAQIKKAYLRKLEIQELESTRTQMAELKLLNQQLVEENTRLSRISHRDNTLITALKNTASQLLSTLNPESAEAISAGELLRNLETLSAERATMANESESEETIPFDTGYSLLDSVLNEMNVQAHRNAIAFSVHFGTGLDVFIPNGIAEIDLMHIVDDLLKNAFKSTLTKETRAVQLQFYKSDKHLVVEVADSGIPFEVESLINMGLERRTTYSDGSGIGLVEIWEAKEKYRATYHLEEYQNADPFTKRISIAFDKKNRYSIRTHRKAEILKQARRADLQVYSDTE